MHFNRLIWLDNLRWVTVFIVLLYHVFYIYNAEGVDDMIPLTNNTPWQDIILYLIYPWFMFLLFLIAGMSTQFALRTQSVQQFFVARTRKLLIPATLGVILLHWISGYYLLLHTGWGTFLGFTPLSCLTMGVGHLWFVQDLWVFSMLILVIRLLDKKDALWNKLDSFLNRCSVENLGNQVIIWGLAMVWFASAFQWESGNLYSSTFQYLYRPILYLVAYLLGYYIFSHEAVLGTLERFKYRLFGLSVVCAIVHAYLNFGNSYASSRIFCSPTFILCLWFVTLSLLSMFKHYCDKQTKLSLFCTKNSYGMYITHWLIVCILGYYLRQYVDVLTPAGVYIVLLVATFVGSYVLYALQSRIPVVRYCLFGLKK